MKVDTYLEALLRKWGAEWFSENLYYPSRSAGFQDYRPKGYKGNGIDLDAPEVERLAEFMPDNLSPIRITVLRVRYRQKVRHMRKAARKMGISEGQYREYFKDSIYCLETRFLRG